VKRIKGVLSVAIYLVALRLLILGERIDRADRWP
jgi:hypothetical protein